MDMKLKRPTILGARRPALFCALVCTRCDGASWEVALDDTGMWSVECLTCGDSAAPMADVMQLEEDK